MCSAGEEPYSLAVDDQSATEGDKNIGYLSIGRKPWIRRSWVYNEKALENLLDFKNRFFTKIQNSYKISDDIKSCVEFKKMAY